MTDNDVTFLRGGGKTGKLIAAFDWAATALGPIEGWPQSLKSAAGLIVNSPVPIVMLWGQDGYMIYNDGYSEFAGGRHPELLGSKVREGWPEVAAFNDNVMKTVLAGGTLAFKDEELTLYRNGVAEAVTMNLDYSPVFDETGMPAGVVAIVLETTQRVLADRKAAAATQRLARMFEEAPGIIAMLSGPQHRFDMANASYRRLVGRDVVGKTVADVLPDAVAQGYLHILDRVYRTGEPFHALGARYVAELQPGVPAGERFLDFIYQPVKDTLGAVTGIFLEGSDITARRQGEIELTKLKESLEEQVAQRSKELQSHEALIRTFFKHSPECHAVIVTDGDLFRYEEVNPATLRLYGKTKEQVVGLTLAEVLDAKTAAELASYFVECLETGQPYKYERAQGDAVLEAVVTPVPFEGMAARRLVVSARDVTDRRSLEQQLRQSQKMEAVGQLTGGLAHDFNNLLTGISGSLELLSARIKQGRAGDVERYVHVAQGAAKRAAALTHRLLAFSRRQTLDAKTTDVNRLVADMEELVRRTVGPAINLEVVSAVGLWSCMVDPNQLENALLNLCINARDAMPDGGRLTIETANKWLDEAAARGRDLTPGQYISLCVTDTGTGMPPETIARAFDPFFTTKPLGEGTGLGLSMVYGFARQSGGQVRIYSELGIGTTMCLYLPRDHGGEAAVEHRAIPNTTSKLCTGRGETVLVVDDEPSVRMLITDVLEEIGFSAIETADGAAGLKVLQSDVRIDLLITDVGLPGGMNGRQMADAGRALRPDLKILFITGYAENAVIGNGHLLPGMQVLTKPFAMESLADRIRGLINSAS